MSAWTRALEVARMTPDSRNRYVDFLRAVSILVVVFGHWLMAAPQMIDGELVVEHLLVAAPWTQFATWVLQVMPVFFVVGGFANAASWESASAAGVGYPAWLRSRMGRLVIPVLPLVAFWTIIGALTGWLGVDPYLIRVGSINALIALWFLAVYVLAVALVPVTQAAWRRFGLWSFWGLVVMAAFGDWLALSGRLPDAGWANYVFIWVAVHQLGYLWRDGGLRGTRRALGWAALGTVALALLLNLGPYPASMVDVPGSEASNSAPPTVVLLALGMVQTGLLAALEPVANRWLKRDRPWAATVLVNGMIMTLFVWHLTAMILMIGLAVLVGGVGLSIEPAGALWWLTRPLWMVIYAMALTAAAVPFGRFERLRVPGEARPVRLWAAVLGTLAVCAGLGMLAYGGIWSEAWPGVNLLAAGLPFAGAVIMGVVAPRKRASVS
jgi:hypothetical protein